jgi:hypothetical protein
MRLVLASLVLLLAASCSSSVPACGPSNCTGCCSASGACVVGSSTLDCGAAGAQCTQCALGSSCFLGQCSSTQTGGGSGSTGGGTGSTGGGGGATGGGGGSTGGGGGASTGGGGGNTGGGGGANTLIPNVMLLVDVSGSMNLPINPSDSQCPASCGTTTANLCPTACATRIGQLRAAISTWLSTRGSSLRLGLTTYPAGTACQVPTGPSVSLPAPTPTDEGTTSALQANASAINTTLQAIEPVGGTPTGDSLRTLASVSGLTSADSRADYVVLITDGLPNCNGSNVNALCGCSSSCTPAQTAACNCTTSACTSSLCSIGCLDGDGAVAAVTQLRNAGIKTAIIGFGADASSATAATVLDNMARAGGAGRVCPNGTTLECGGLICRADRTCEQSYYSAATANELQAALNTLF